MNLKDFTHKFQTMKLSHTLIKELDLIECRCYIDHLTSKEFLLRLFFKTGRDRSRTEESIDFHIFLEQSLFKILTVVLPDNASIDQIDQLLKISKIVEEHVKSAFSETASEIRNLKEVYDLIDRFNNRAYSTGRDLKIYIADNQRIRLFVPKMHPHQKPREFTIAIIYEHTIEDLIFMMKMQIKALEFYEELLYREDFAMVQFKLSSKYRFTIDAILKDELDRNVDVRVRMIDPDFVEVTYSIYSKIDHSEYVQISDKNSQISYKVIALNDVDDGHDFLITTATSQRCSLKDFSKTLSDVRFRLKDRIIHIRPVAE